MSLYLKGAELHQYIDEDRTKVIFKNLQTDQFEICPLNSMREYMSHRLDFFRDGSFTGLLECSIENLKVKLENVFPLYIITVEVGSGYKSLFYEGTRKLPFFHKGFLFTDHFPYPMKIVRNKYKTGEMVNVQTIYIPAPSMNNVIRLNLFGK